MISDQFDVAAEVTGDRVTLKFGLPISIIKLTVANSSEEPVWELIDERFQPVPEGREGGRFRSWPLNEAPAGVIELLRRAEARAERELREQSPGRPLIETLAYGDQPQGYRCERPALPLVRGDYAVIVFAEQGHGVASFRID